MNLKNFPKRVDSKTNSCLRITVPENLDLALEGLIRKVLREQPKIDDIHAFAADYFETLLRIRDKAGTRPGPAQLCPFHNDEDAHEMVKLAGSFHRAEGKAGRPVGSEARGEDRGGRRAGPKGVKPSGPSKQATPDLIRKLPRVDVGEAGEEKKKEEVGARGEGDEEELVGGDPIRELVEKELMMKESAKEETERRTELMKEKKEEDVGEEKAEEESELVEGGKEKDATRIEGDGEVDLERNTKEGMEEEMTGTEESKKALTENEGHHAAVDEGKPPEHKGTGPAASTREADNSVDEGDANDAEEKKVGDAVDNEKKEAVDNVVAEAGEKHTVDTEQTDQTENKREDDHAVEKKEVDEAEERKEVDGADGTKEVVDGAVDGKTEGNHGKDGKEGEAKKVAQGTEEDRIIDEAPEKTEAKEETVEDKTAGKTEESVGAETKERDHTEAKTSDETEAGQAVERKELEHADARKEDRPDEIKEVVGNVVDKTEENQTKDTKEADHTTETKEVDDTVETKGVDHTEKKELHHTEETKEEDQTEEAKREDQTEEAKKEDQTEEAKREDQTEEAKGEDQTEEAKGEDQTEEAKGEDQTEEAKREDQTEEAKGEDQTEEAKREDQTEEAKKEDQTEEAKKEDQTEETKREDHAEETKELNQTEEAKGEDEVEERKADQTAYTEEVVDNTTDKTEGHDEKDAKEADNAVDKSEGNNAEDKIVEHAQDKEAIDNAGGEREAPLVEETKGAEDGEKQRPSGDQEAAESEREEESPGQGEKGKTEEKRSESRGETAAVQSDCSVPEEGQGREKEPHVGEASPGSTETGVKDKEHDSAPRPEVAQQEGATEPILEDKEDKEKAEEEENDDKEVMRETVAEGKTPAALPVLEKIEEVSDSDDSKEESDSSAEPTGEHSRKEGKPFTALEEIPEGKEEVEPAEAQKQETAEEKGQETSGEMKTEEEKKQTSSREESAKEAAGEEEPGESKTKDEGSPPAEEAPEGEELCTVVDIQSIRKWEREKSGEEGEKEERKAGPEEVCIVVDDEHVTRVEGAETGNEDSPPSEEVQIKTIQTHYYDTLQVPAAVTKELRVHSMGDPPVPASPSEEAKASRQEASPLESTESLVTNTGADLTAGTSKPGTGEVDLNLGSDSERTETDELLDLMTPTSGYSLNLSDLSWRTVSGMFLDSERHHSSLDKEELRLVTSKSSEDARAEVEEVFHKTEIPSGVRAVPVPPRDAEEIREEGDEGVLKGEEKKEKEEKEEEKEEKKEKEEKEEEKKGGEESLGDESTGSGSSSGKSIDSDAPVVSVEVKTVIESQIVGEGEEEEEEEKVEVKVEVEVGGGEDEEERERTGEGDDSGKEKEATTGEGGGEREGRPPVVGGSGGGSGSGDGTSGKGGSSGDSESTVSSAATEIKRSEFARRRGDGTGRSLLASQSLDKYSAGGRNPLLRTRSLSTFRHGVTDFEVWNAIEKELEEAATKIQSRFRRYKTRKKLQRENAVQITTEESSPTATPPEPDQPHRSTGEFHDSIVLSEHPR